MQVAVHMISTATDLEIQGQEGADEVEAMQQVYSPGVSTHSNEIERVCAAERNLVY